MTSPRAIPGTPSPRFPITAVEIFGNAELDRFTDQAHVVASGVTLKLPKGPQVGSTLLILALAGDVNLDGNGHPISGASVVKDGSVAKVAFGVDQTWETSTGAAAGNTGNTGNTGAEGRTGNTGTTGNTGPAPPIQEIVFRPGGTPSPGVVNTWAGVKSAIAAATVPLTVWLDDSIAPCEVPPGDGVTDFQNLVTLVAIDPGGASLLVNDGATLRNPTYLKGASLSFACVTAPGLAFSGLDASLLLTGSTFMERTTNNAQPACEVVDGQTLSIAFEGFPFRASGSSAFLNGGNGKPIFHVQDNALLNLTTLGPFSYDNGTVSGAALSTVAVGYDTDLFQFPSFPSMLGTLIEFGVEGPIGIPSAGSITVDYDARPGEIVRVDSAGGDLTVSLPEIGVTRIGTQVIVKCITTSAHTITVQPSPINPGTTIDGVATDSLAPAVKKLSRIYSLSGPNGWLIVGDY